MNDLELEDNIQHAGHVVREKLSKDQYEGQNSKATAPEECTGDRDHPSQQPSHHDPDRRRRRPVRSNEGNMNEEESEIYQPTYAAFTVVSKLTTQRAVL